jgi:glucose-1-phosphatase
MDPVFNPQITRLSEGFLAKAYAEIEAMGGPDAPLKAKYALLEKVLDIKSSPAARHDTTAFGQFPSSVHFEVGKEPMMRGGLKMACSASDALTLQYYEEPDETKAAFGHKLTLADWQYMHTIADTYSDMLFTAPLVSVNAAHPMLQELYSEINTEGRKFTFLCGHDSNIASVLAALDVEEYSLPNSIEKKTPIGSKLVIEKFAGKDGKEYAAMSLVYQNPEQLRDRTALTLDTPPEIFPLKLKGIKANADGVYKLKDVQKRFEQAIQAYDKLPQDKAEKKAA